MKKILIASLSAALVIVPVSAASARGVSIAVSHEGLDLSNPADIETMKARIDEAVTNACAKIAVGSDRNYCVADGKAKAMAELTARSRIAIAYTNAAR